MDLRPFLICKAARASKGADMSLGQLSLIGSVNACSTGVWLTNQLIGATILVKKKVGGTIVGGGTAVWVSQQFTINQQPANTVLTATQSLGGATSPGLDFTVGPYPTQAQVNSGAFYQPIYACGQCVFLTGMVPNAQVVVSSNGQNLGNAVVNADGRVEVLLSRLLTPGDHLYAVQTACNGLTTSPPIDGGTPQVFPTIIPKLTVEPVFACDRSIVVTNVLPGGRVTVSRGSTQLGQLLVPAPTVTFVVAPLAASGPPIVAVEDFPQCKHGPGTLTSDQVQVSGGKLNAPTIAAQVCAGDSTVDVGNLHIGALVEVDINGVPTQFTAAATHKTFSVSTLTAGVVVTARQGLCNPPVWSNPSTAATVGVTGLIPPICVSPPDKIHNEMLTP